MLFGHSFARQYVCVFWPRHNFENALETRSEPITMPVDACDGLCRRFSRTAVARVSDDYYPRDPASSTPHIGACAFNSLYLGALVQPDWDMFQSAHPAGETNVIIRWWSRKPSWLVPWSW